MASRTRPAEASATRVWMGRRSSGGVSMTLMSRTPTSARFSVRGMGVAESVRTSTSVLQLLEALLVGHAEALLLVDHDEPQVPEADVLAEQPVRADDDVHAARREAGQRLVLLGAGHEAGQRADRDGVRREALAEGHEVLRGQDRGRHQDGHLGARLDRLEGGPQGHLRLAVADVAHDEAVHGRVPLQVGLDLDGGAQLVGRLLVGEGRLHLGLPG